MFCPNCANESGPQQKYCRACGLRLDVINEAVRQELRDSAIEPVRHSWLRSIFMTAWHYGLLLLLLGTLIIAFGKKVVGEQLIADIGTVMSFVGMGFLVARGMLVLKASGDQRNYRDSEGNTTTELTPQIEAKEQASIDEFATRQFDPRHVERKSPKTPAGDHYPKS